MCAYNSERERILRLLNEADSIVPKDWHETKILLDLMYQGHVVKLGLKSYAITHNSKYNTKSQ